MRSILACAACRRLKIKCVHNGSPPCRACLRGCREAACSLVIIGKAQQTPPRPADGRRRRRATTQNTATPPLPAAGDGDVAAPASQPQLRASPPSSPLARRQATDPVRDAALDDAALQGIAPGAVITEGSFAAVAPAPVPDLPPAPRPPGPGESPAASTPTALIVQATWAVVHKFPEFAFIHTPTFFASIQDGTADDVKICAVLALAGRFVPELVRLRGGSIWLTGEGYAEYVRAQLSTRVFDGTSVDVIQCLLLLAMYEWGACLGFRTWMYLGMAIRMSQTLRIQDDRGLGGGTPAERETCKRTVWSCFLIDRLISCGKDRSMAFDLKDMQLPLPVSDQEFTFGLQEGGEGGSTAVSNGTHGVNDPGSAGQSPDVVPTPSSVPLAGPKLGIDHQFTILLQGIDIWTAVSKWTSNGGRKLQHGLADCPWRATAAWHRLSQRLEDWRSRQDERMLYAPARLTAHVRGGYAEAFVLINLLYYMCHMFLHREFVPFLPLRVSRPVGPIDPPLYVEDAPPGWWEASCRTLYAAADSITDMLRDLDAAGQALCTPFVGFCAFSAATLHLYMHKFPHMDPGRSPHAGQRLEQDLAYLRAFQAYWKIGASWMDTMDEARQLYDRALANREQFQSATRYDYVSLETRHYDFGDIQTGPSRPSTAGHGHPSVAASGSGSNGYRRSSRQAAHGQAARQPDQALPATMPETRPETMPTLPTLSGPPATLPGPAGLLDPTRPFWEPPMPPPSAFAVNQFDNIDEDFWRQLDSSIMGDGPNLFREV